MFCYRLKEARSKLGLTQSEFGELLGAKKRTVADWEKGVSSPTGLQLEKLAQQNVDVKYIITGQETNPIPPSLPADEQLLIDTYRALPLAKRREMLASLLTGDTPKSNKVKGGKGGVIQGNGNIQVGGITR